jgi:undecaprenyl-diphosphatase
VQGLTEFIPISSTAHLRIFPALMGWPDPGAAFTAVIQIGTLIAVLIYFWRDLTRAFMAWAKSLVPSKRGEDPQGARMGWAIFVGTIPIVIAGVLFKDRIENDWRSLYVIAYALIGMALLLLVAERVGTKKRTLEQTTIKDGLWVGLWQCIALIPGSSRSGSTITGALFGGLDRPTAARFSFLLSVPSILAAAVFSLLEHRQAMMDELGAILVASFAALVSGYLSIAFLIRFLQRHGTYLFIVYRILLGILIIVLLQAGILAPFDEALAPTP